MQKAILRRSKLPHTIWSAWIWTWSLSARTQKWRLKVGLCCLTDLYFGYQAEKSTKEGISIRVDLIISLSPFFHCSKQQLLSNKTFTLYHLPEQEESDWISKGTLISLW